MGVLRTAKASARSRNRNNRIKSRLYPYKTVTNSAIINKKLN
jgi:hypothetical protein